MAAAKKPVSKKTTKSGAKSSAKKGKWVDGPGIKLFERSKGRVRLTDSGRRLRI